MFMFGITTLMFALGIIALVLVNTFSFKRTRVLFGDTEDVSEEHFTTYIAWGAITCLMVRLLGAPGPLHR